MQSWSTNVLKKLLIVSLTAMLVASCQSGAAPDAWCMTNDPQRPSAKEIAVMSPERVKSQLAHNRYGEKRCGWKS